MPVPQPIVDAQSAVQADFDTVTTLVATAAASASAATAAGVQATADVAAAITARQHLQADLDALVALEKSTYSI
jgi:hypothetical protein